MLETHAVLQTVETNNDDEGKVSLSVCTTSERLFVERYCQISKHTQAQLLECTRSEAVRMALMIMEAYPEELLCLAIGADAAERVRSTKEGA